MPRHTQLSGGDSLFSGKSTRAAAGTSASFLLTRAVDEAAVKALVIMVTTGAAVEVIVIVIGPLVLVASQGNKQAVRGTVLAAQSLCVVGECPAD